jgi:deazaflavin-dependent oxidoreductase (nitroreductase family)
MSNIGVAHTRMNLLSASANTGRCGTRPRTAAQAYDAADPDHGGTTTDDLRSRVTRTMQKRLANPAMRLMPWQTLLETTGRRSDRPRHTPLGGRLVGNQFWLVSEFGGNSDYVRNIKANPGVRVRLGGKWRSGTAHLLPDDDAKARLRELPQMNSFGVRSFGTSDAPQGF